MKLYRVSRAQAMTIVRWGRPDGVDARGNPRFAGEAEGRTLHIIVAVDDPDLVITIIPRRT